MPLLKITSNLPDGAVKELLPALSKAVAHVLGKPESYVAIAYTPCSLMMFGGEFIEGESCFCSLANVGALTKEKNEAMSAELCKILGKAGIKPDQTYIEFSGKERQDFGWNGSTFA